MERSDSAETVDTSDVDVDVDVADTFDTATDDRPEIEVPEEASLHLENIGGIDTTEVALDRGITVLAGQNATNRTSTLKGLCAVLGATDTTPAAQTLSTDAEQGEVTLSLGDETYTRSYQRGERGTVHVDGTPYTESSGVVDAFVALLEDNPARSAIRRGAADDELRDILMRPVDTAAIDEEIAGLEEQRRYVDDRIDEIERERKGLGRLEERRQALEDDLDDLKGDIEEVQREVEEYEADEEEAERAEELLEELQTLRSDLGETEDRVEYHHDKAESYRGDLEAVEREKDDIDPPKDELQRISDAISQLERQKRRVEDTIADLDAIINVNETLVEDGTGVTTDGADEGESATTADDLTAALNPDAETVECWTCGTEVERSAIGDRIETLRQLRREKRSEIDDIEADISERRERKRSLEQRRDEYDELRSRAETLEEKITFHEGEADSLEAEAQDLREEIAALEEQVEETEDLRESDLVDAYQRLSELKYERGRVEQELDDVEDQIDHIEGLAEEREELVAARDEIKSALDALRGRVDEAEQAVVETFNEQMETVVERLDYSNVTRVWLERKPGDDTAEAGTFTLHVVRENSSGTVYEDTVDTLSESEREVIGLVVALTGYVVHRVYEDVPFLVLDSVEAIDASRIASVLDYFGQRTGFLVAALLQEDADALQTQPMESGTPSLTQVAPDPFTVDASLTD